MEQQVTEQQPDVTRVACDMDTELFRRMKIAVAELDLKGYGRLIDTAVREYLDRLEAKA